MLSLHKAWKGYSSIIKPQPFPFTPFNPPPVIESTGKSFKVAVHGVDSNSGFAEGMVNWNPTAEGCIAVEEVLQLKKSFEEFQGSGDFMHVLMCHHSFSPGDGEFPHPLLPSSRGELLNLARDFALMAVLTGHQHTFWVHDWLAERIDGTLLPVAEFRSPTTTQGPSASNNIKWKRPGFWLFEISRASKKTARLLPTQYSWNGRRFERAPQDKQLLPDGAHIESNF